MTDSEIISLEPNIQNCLENIAKDEKLSDYTINVSKGTNSGDNYLSLIFKIDIKGIKNEKNHEVNLICKCAPKVKEYREFTDVEKYFKKEEYVYQQLFPIYENFQKEKNIKKPFNSIAKYYASSLTEFEEYIVLENMKSKGFVMLNRKIPLSLETCLLVMKEYGKVHALSLALQDQKPEVFSKILKGYEEDAFIENFRKNMELAEQNSARLDKLNSILKLLDPTKEKHVLYKIGEFFKTLKTNLPIFMSSKDKDGFVIAHGDCWTNNFLFKYENSSKNAPSRLCFLDWQLSRFGSPAHDLSYFLFSCTRKELRDNHYNELLKAYHTSLSEFLTILGSDPKILFPYDKLLDHMEKYSGYGMLMATIVIPLMMGNADEVPDVRENDTESKEELMKHFQKNLSNDEEIGKVIVDVFRDFVKYGYL